MRVVAVEVEDFGVFSGKHRFPLVASTARSGHPARTLIVGHNGSGKSTLFRAISLALYGPVSLGSRVSRQAYQEYLGSLVHRGAPGLPTSGATAARVAVDLEYIRGGASESLRLERSWQRRGASNAETATANWLTDDGSIAGPVEEHLVAELLPSDLRKMMLVDVALVDELTQVLQSPGALERILRELTGLKLVERLRGDLLTVGSQAKGGAPQQHDTELLQRWSARVLEIDEALDETRSLVLQAETHVADIERAIAEKERELMSVGGGVAANLPALRERLGSTEAELEQTIGELRDLCNGTLPFALCPSVCLELDARLVHEALSFGAESVMAHADEWLDDLCSELVADKDFRELVPEAERRLAISEHLRRSASRSLGAKVRLPKHAPVHDLSERDRMALRGWIAEAVGVMPSRVTALSQTLDRLEVTRDGAREELDRVPDESGLKVVQHGLRDLREQLVKTNSDAMRAQDLLDALETERLELLAQTRELEEQLVGAAAEDRVAELICRTRLALADFEREQLQRRAVEFADALVDIFNSLSRKQTLLAAAAYDPAAGVFSMVDAEGRELDPSKLSTGELQLYSMAVLESLRVTGGRDYPLLVDTPLAYLDEQHREALLSGVLFGSHSQVVLFATDQEIDSRALQRWSPDVDHAYRLVFDATAQSSSATVLDGSGTPPSLSLEGQVA